MSREKVLALETELRGQFLDRAPVIRGLLCALVARQHVLLLGPPGTGKSALANALCGALSGARYFAWLLTRHSTPEEIFGPVSLSALKADKFTRVTTGKLPEAHVGFLDEIFKSNAAILNALLTIVNERRYHNNGGAVPVPLELVIGASNELPESEELGALFDRFLLRFWVEPLRSDGDFVDLLMAPEPKLGVTLSLDELHVAQSEAAALTVPRAVVEQLAELRRELGAAGLPAASDRRWKAAVSLLRAEAWLSGDASVGTDHFGVLSAALWSDPEQRAEVAGLVAKHTATALAEARQVFDAIVDLVARIPDKGDGRTAALAKVAKEGRQAVVALGALRQAAASEKAREGVGALERDIEVLLVPLRAEARKALGLG